MRSRPTCTTPDEAKVKADNTTLYARPDGKSRVVKPLSAGQRVRVSYSMTNASGVWCGVDVADTPGGYMLCSSLDWPGGERSVNEVSEFTRQLLTEYLRLEFGSRPDLLAKVVGKLGRAGGHDRRAGGLIPLASVSESAIDQIQSELRKRLLKAMHIEECRGQRLVSKRDILQNLHT